MRQLRYYVFVLPPFTILYRRGQLCDTRIYPVGIWCQNDVVSTSMRRDHVASTLIPRHFHTKCPLGRSHIWIVLIQGSKYEAIKVVPFRKSAEKNGNVPIQATPVSFVSDSGIKDIGVGRLEYWGGRGGGQGLEFWWGGGPRGAKFQAGT